MRNILILGAMVMTLTACGTKETSEPSTVELVSARAKAVLSGANRTPPAPPPPLPSRAELTASGNSVIMGQLASRGATATLGLARENGSTRTYFSTDGISLSLQNGILFSTRGLGEDLMSSDHAGLYAALTHGHSHGSHTRRYRHLNSMDQLQVTTLTCTLTAGPAQTIDIMGVKHRTTPILESCKGDGPDINNLFFVGGGTIWRSSQWISPDLGPVIIDLIQ